MTGRHRSLGLLFRCVSACVVALMAGSLPATAQDGKQAGSTRADGLSLREAVQAGLRHATDLQVQRSLVASDRGALQQVRGRFNPRFQGTVTRLHDPGLASLARGPDTESDLLGYTVGLSVLSRAGISIRPELALEQQRVNGTGTGEIRGSVAAARLNVNVPLMEGRWGQGLRAAEQAAVADVRAGRSNLAHTRSLTVLAVSRAYWDHRAAHSRLSVLRGSEERARSLVEKLRRLVEVEERPEADLDQALATLLERRVSRIGAEQAVVESRRRLGIEMGLDAARVEDLPPPADRLPRLEEVEEVPASSERLASLVETALGRRADLTALVGARAANRHLLRAARDGLRPRVDLGFSVGYESGQRGTGFGELFTSFFEHVPGVAVTAELQMEWPMGNDGARGVAAARRATVRRQDAQLAALRREIRTAVRVQLEGLKRASTTVRQASRAVTLNRRIVDNETRRSELGVATIIDVILTEDRLNRARLSWVNARRDLAIQLVGLRFATGSLFRPGDGDTAEVLADLTEAP